MGYMTYGGPADVLFIQEDQEKLVPALEVRFTQTHTAVFDLSFTPDRPERQGCTALRVTLPDGRDEAGAVTYSTWGTLVFAAGYESDLRTEHSP